MLQIDFCTGNKSKLKEANDYINSKVKEVSLYSNKIDFIEIQSISQQEILLDKMKQAITKTDRPFIIDETGIYFNKYNNYPGTLTKYVIKSLGIEGIKRLLCDSDNTAYFKTTILYSEDKQDYKFFEGILKGKIVIDENRIDNVDFPFSSIFIPEGYNDYLVNINNDNNFLDHRKKALDKLIKYLNNS